MANDFGFIGLKPIAIGAVATNTVASSEGQFAFSHSGTGTYTLTVNADTLPAYGFVSLNSAAGQINITRSSNVFTVHSFAADGTTPTDKDFSFVLFANIPSS